jgi:SSS family solute:Na+ symporter
LFLYASYYGCDQSQAQRLLTAAGDRSARRALLLNGLLRFPLVMTYCGFGLLLAALLQIEPEFAAMVNGKPADRLVPTFMMAYLPAGLRGLLLAAILAAAMSSIDSALNSLAAITLDDVLGRAPERQSVWLGRLTSLAWGVFAVGSGMVFARSGAGILELINQLGSAFYGPVLAVFVLGALAPRVRERAVLGGLAASLLANLIVARGAPGVSWLWWNPLGFLCACAVALALTGAPLELRRPNWPRVEGALLIGAFVVMLMILALLPTLLRVLI